MESLISRRALFWLLLTLALFWFISAIQTILLPFIVGMGVAYLLDPSADRLERLGLSRTMATTLITVGFFGLLCLGLLWLVPTILEQTQQFLNMLPSYVEQLRLAWQNLLAQYGGFFGQEQLDSAREAVNGSGKELTSAMGKLISQLVSSGAAIINIVSLLVISPIVSFYLLRDWDRIIEKLDGLLPRAHAETIREQLHQIDKTLSGYLRGVVNVMFVLGLFYVLGLSLVGLNFAILIGIIGGIAIIIPYLGTIISGGAAVGMAYLQFDDWQPVAITLGIFTAGQMLEGYVLTPKLVGDRVGLHPLWLIFGMLAGATLFGFVGIFLAIPVTAVIGVLTRFAVARYKQSELYSTPASNA